MSRLITLLAGFLFLVWASSIATAMSDPAAVADAAHEHGHDHDDEHDGHREYHCHDRFCGVSAMYAASIYLDRELGRDDLLKGSNLSCSIGSSLGDLVEIAEEHRFPHASMRSIDRSELIVFKSPVVFETVVNNEDQPVRHFAVQFPSVNGEPPTLLHRGRLVEDPAARELLYTQMTGDILVIDGKASAVADAQTSRHRRHTFVTLGAVGLGTLLVLLAGRATTWMGLSPDRFRSALVLVPALLGSAAVTAVTARVLPPLVGLPAIGEIPDGFADTTLTNLRLERIGLDEVSERMRSGSVLIDARPATDYQAHTIPGAMNVPIGSNGASRKVLTAGLDSNQPLIIFCGNVDCPYAETVARALASDGFTNIAVFSGGMLEWNEREMGQPQTEATR